MAAKRLPDEEAPPSGALSGVSESDLETGPAGLSHLRNWCLHDEEELAGITKPRLPSRL
jgi:hypothetical protein